MVECTSQVLGILALSLAMTRKHSASYGCTGSGKGTLWPSFVYPGLHPQ